jgi:hypothetical protein
MPPLRRSSTTTNTTTTSAISPSSRQSRRPPGESADTFSVCFTYCLTANQQTTSHAWASIHPPRHSNNAEARTSVLLLQSRRHRPRARPCHRNEDRHRPAQAPSQKARICKHTQRLLIYSKRLENYAKSGFLAGMRQRETHMHPVIQQ